MNCQNRINKYRTILILLCMIFQTNCRVDRDFELISKLNLAKRDINSDVVIYAPFGWNSQLIGEPVSIMVENKGKEIIIFPNDYGIGVYIQDDENWIELDLVETKYILGEISLKPAEKNPLYYGSTMFEPIVKDQSSQVKIRIVVVGWRFIGGIKTDQQVAAYTDMWLFPKE